MKKRVLVYDNQLGYYELMTQVVDYGYDFFLFNKKISIKDAYDAVVFFLHDDLELLDMVKLYDPQIPFILGTSKKTNAYLHEGEAVFILDISNTKDDIERNLQAIFNDIGQLNEKEEAL